MGTQEKREVDCTPAQSYRWLQKQTHARRHFQGWSDAPVLSLERIRHKKVGIENLVITFEDVKKAL